MSTTSIEWTDITWNLVVGCTRVSPGCERCYAEIMASRQVLMSAALGRQSVYLPVVDTARRRWNRNVELLPARLAEPLSFRPGTRVFVCSMSDLFHDGVPFEYIAAVWGVMASRPDVTFQVLTKRPQRMAEFLEYLLDREVHASAADVCLTDAEHLLSLQGVELPMPATAPWPLPNVWLGTSVEDQQRAEERIPHLLAAPAAVRFLSVEPLLGPVDLEPLTCQHCGGHEASFADEPGSQPWCVECDAEMGAPGWLNEIDWVIVGGESGPGARPMDGAWVRSLRDQCDEADVAFFFKQWGGANKAKAGRELDGRTHDAMPEVRRA